MAKLKKLSQVELGSIIRIGGENWEVIQNTAIDLRIRGGDRTTWVSLEVGRILGKDALITVIAEPSTSPLVEYFKKQLTKQNSIDSLFQQIEEQQEERCFYCHECVEDCICDEEDYWEEDWGGDSWVEDLKEEEDFEDESHSTSIDIQARLNASLARKKAIQASKLASKAGLQAQVACQTASQAKEFVQELATEITGEIEGVYDEISRVVTEANQAFAHVNVQLDSMVTQAQDAFADIDQRVTKLENKERVQMFNQQLQAQFNAKLQEKKAEQTKGGFNMKNLMENFKGLFGKVEGVFALSPAGLAMRKGLTNSYVVFDQKTGRITDVDSLVLNFDVPAFRLPLEAKDIKVGMIVVSNGEYAYVTEVVDDYVRVVYPAKAVQGTVLPVTNFLFGKPFYTVVQTIDMAAQGGFNPALLLAISKGNKNDILPFLLMNGGLGSNPGAVDPTLLLLLSEKSDDLLPFLLLQQGGIAKEGFNPLMFLLLDDKADKDSLLPLLLMQQQGGQAGEINPLFFLLGDGDIDIKTLALMGGFGGQNPFGSLFAPATTPKQPTKDAGKDK